MNRLDDKLSKRQPFTSLDANFKVLLTDSLEQLSARVSQSLRSELLVPEFIAELVLVLSQGAESYGAFNWRCAEDASNMKIRHVEMFLNTLEHHLLAFEIAFKDGVYDDVDADSGISHMVHIAANAMFMHSLMRDISKAVNEGTK